MPKGPFGGPRPFTRDKKTILVLIGVSSAGTDKTTRLQLQESVNNTINRALIEHGADININRQTVNMTVEPNPSTIQIRELGGGTMQVQQFDIKTELTELSHGFINAVHNTVVDEVENMGFDITGVKTTVS